MLVETPHGTSVRIVRTFTVPVARTYAAFVEPDQMAQWMWGALGSNVTAASDPQVGGRYECYTDAPSGHEDVWHTQCWGMVGVYAVVEPRERLVYSLHWDAPVGYNQGDSLVPDEVVVVEFESKDESTIVEFLHLGIPDDGQSAATHAEGIAQTFDQLDRVLAGFV